MRLLQLARKTGIRKDDIIDYLEHKGIAIDKGSHNVKIPDEIVPSILEHFKIESPEVNTIINEENEELIENEVQSRTLVEDQESNSPDNETQSASPEEVEIPETQQENLDAEEEKEEEEKVEVIRVKKIKLEGVKVVGKIELPENPEIDEEINPEPTASEESSEIIEKISKPKRNVRRPEHRGRNKKSLRKELTYEEKLKREERKKDREANKLAKAKKEKKRKHYEKQIEKSRPIVKKKKKKKPFPAEDLVTEKPQYKSPVRRFWAWLNGEYDN